jgi:hypothetical protein
MTESQAEEILKALRLETYVCVNQTSWRYGQALFNTVHRHYPDFADSVRGSDIDCFHRTTMTPEFEKALMEWLKEKC